MAVFLATEQHRNGVLLVRGAALTVGRIPDGGLSRPAGVTMHPDGLVVVADAGDHRLALWDQFGSGWAFVGGPGSGQLEFDRPSAVTCADDGVVYVADSGNHRIARLDLSGARWAVLGAAGRPAGEDGAPFKFADPRALTIDSAGRLTVADPGNSRLVRFDLDAFDVGPPGGWEVVPLPAGVNPARPFGVCALGPGLAVTDVMNRAVHVLGADDAVLASVDHTQVRMAIPAFVCALGPDRLLVGDPSANTIQVFRWEAGQLTEEDLVAGSDPERPQPAFQRLAGLCAGGI